MSHVGKKVPAEFRKAKVLRSATGRRRYETHSSHYPSTAFQQSTCREFVMNRSRSNDADAYAGSKQPNKMRVLVHLLQAQITVIRFTVAYCGTSAHSFASPICSINKLSFLLKQKAWWHNLTSYFSLSLGHFWLSREQFYYRTFHQ